MKCDLCEKPAVIHEVVVKSGVKKEIHLCEKHATAKGYAVPGQQPIDEMLTQFIISKSSKPARVMSKACDACGLTFARFRQAGVLGCTECYKAFDKNLSTLIERAQCGATHHVGKSPRHAGGSLERQRLIQRLLKELDEAVDAEQYERAATLRDRLRSLEGNGANDSDNGNGNSPRVPGAATGDGSESEHQI